MLTDAEQLRYSRQIMLPDWGKDGQQRLKNASVLIIGCGGLGSAAAMYLAGAGVGALVLVDDDVVDSSNLQRQLLYRSADIGTSKVEAAKQQLLAINPALRVRVLNKRLELNQLSMEAGIADVVLDCTDTLASRQLISEACRQAKARLVVGAAIRWDGQLISFDFAADDSACYRCVFPSDQQQGLSCATAGIVGPVVGTIGNLQALETLRWLVGMTPASLQQLQLFDGQSLRWQQLMVSRDSHCPACGQGA